jgi:hypothetical protein
MRSEKFVLVTQDLKKIGVGALIAMGGAFITYLANTIPNIDFGDYTPLIVALNSVLVNVLRKYISETIYK